MHKVTNPNQRGYPHTRVDLLRPGVGRKAILKLRRLSWLLLVFFDLHSNHAQLGMILT